MALHSARIKNIVLVAIAVCGTRVSAHDGFIALRNEGPLTFFKGAATLEGKVVRRTDPTTLELMGDLVCFEAAEVSRMLIPRSPDDERDAWFCFDDHQGALKLLRLPKLPIEGTCGYSARATVRVTSYILNRAESEVTDLAKLVSVVARGPVRDIKCQ